AREGGPLLLGGGWRAGGVRRAAGARLLAAHIQRRQDGAEPV
ncbi:MAG: hypothetical protein AVDCRST_MAG22-3361, partial [uncultured Rubrobacteraceae bacterium]